MSDEYCRMRSEIQRNTWRDPNYRAHMILVHTGKRYPSASLKKRGTIPWNKAGKRQPCLHCGKIFWIPPVRFQTAKYCSRRCTRLANNGLLTSQSSRAKAHEKRWKNPENHAALSRKMRQLWRHMGSTERERRLGNMRKACRGRHLSFATRDLIRKARLQQVFPVRDTRIEWEMQQALSDRGIVFAKHLPILNCCQADVAFPEEKLAVFCDGDYWHNRPDVRSKDIIQEMILRANGWRVLRFWEHEINTSPAACAERLVNELSTS